MIRTISKLSVLSFIFAVSGNIYAANILLDHSVKCGSLVCFPSADNKNEYYYVPSEPHLAMHKDGTPEFSFLRYVENTSTGGEVGIQEASGGAIIHFLVDYSVDKNTLDDASAELADQNKEAVIIGPVQFTEGHFALVSNFLTEIDKEGKQHQTELSHQVLGMGRAPLLEGHKSAVSMHLTKKGAKLLWESFKMATPDISLVFEMSFSGLRDPVNASITANWDKLRNQSKTDVGVGFAYGPIALGFDYSNFWDKARQSGAIKINYKGDPDKLNTIIDRAYQKLQDMVFEPISIDNYQPQEQQSTGMQSMLDTAMSGNSGSGERSQIGNMPFRLKLSSGYKRRHINKTGSITLSFNQQSMEKLNTLLTGNIGNLYKKYGKNTSIFKTVNVSDNAYKRRSISILLDARNIDDFKKYVNYVTLTLEKKHGSGKETIQEVTITRNNFNQGKSLVVSYPWDNESSYGSWEKYSYKIAWSFIGGASYETKEKHTTVPAVAITPPYEYKSIEFTADRNMLAQKQVRLATVRVWHDFFGRKVKEVINIIPASNVFSVTKEFAVPFNDDKIAYEITWTLKNGKRYSSGKMSSDSAVIFCDEVKF